MRFDQFVNYGNGKGCCFTGSGLGHRQHIFPFEDRRDGFKLNVGWFQKSLLFKAFFNGIGDGVF